MNIVIVNGWAMPSSIWSDFCSLLSDKITSKNCKIIDIDRCLNIKSWLRYLDDSIEPDTLLIGWSLGGMLALEYAHQHPDKLRGICCLHMNPKFVVADDWPAAMAPEEFEAFKQLANRDDKVGVKKLIKQFSFLTTTKGLDAISDLKALKSTFSVESIPRLDVLNQSLGLLESLDVRGRISALEIPQYYLLGEHDQLVPQAAVNQIQALNHSARVELLKGVSHFPCYSAAERIVASMTEFAGELN